MDAVKTVPVHLLLLVGLAGAASLAAAVFILPMPFLRPDLGEKPRIPSMLREDPASTAQKPPKLEAKPWSTLAAELEDVRFPMPEQAPQTPLAGEEGDPESPTPQPTQESPLDKLPWRFIAYVIEAPADSEPRLVAWIEFDFGKQRAVAVGDYVPFSAASGSPRVFIKSITESTLTLEMNEHTRELQFEPRSEGIDDLNARR